MTQKLMFSFLLAFSPFKIYDFPMSYIKPLYSSNSDERVKLSEGAILELTWKKTPVSHHR